MNRSQANGRDRMALKWHEKKVMYRLPFRKCGRCEASQLFKAHNPNQVGWSLWCWECGAKDAQTEPPQQEQSAGPRMEPGLSRQVVKEEVAAMRAELVRRGLPVY